MRMKIIAITILVCIPIIPNIALAGDFDGSKPMLCTVIDVNECVTGEECKKVQAEEINLPRYLYINVKKKIIQNKKDSEESRKSEIEHVKEVGGKLILQGAESGGYDVQDGFGWTIAIMADTGQMVMTASGDLVAEVVSGICTLQ